jgi:hypothetical protein
LKKILGLKMGSLDLDKYPKTTFTEFLNFCIGSGIGTKSELRIFGEKNKFVTFTTGTKSLRNLRQKFNKICFWVLIQVQKKHY